MTEAKNGHGALPYRLGRVLFQALEEVMGCQEVDAVFAHLEPRRWMADPLHVAAQAPLPLAAASSLQAMLEQAYGLHGGQGLALRAGQVSFKYGLRAFGVELGLFEMPFRLLPLRGKLEASAATLGAALQRASGSAARLERQQEGYTWRLEDCPACRGRQAQAPDCHLVTGFLQEGLYWLSGGKSIPVVETACLAAGDPTCAFTFDLRPAE